MAEHPREAEQEDAWYGVSCTSWLWPHTSDPAQFEIRRAVVNMVPGLREVSNEEGPSTEDVLRVLRATHSAQKAISETLSVVVAEAVSRGATWRQIGDVLGIGKQGAHNRFSKGIPAELKDRIVAEEDVLSIMQAILADAVPESILGFTEDDWEAAPPEVAVQHSIRAVSHASLLLKEAILNRVDGQDATDLFYRASEQMRGAFRTFMTKRVMTFLSEFIAQEPRRPISEDVQPATYFAHFIFRLAAAYMNFGYALSRAKEDENRKYYYLMMAQYHLTQGVLAISRPECIEMYARIEQKVRDGGNAVFVGSPHEGKGGDMLEALYAYWKNDRDLMSSAVGIEVKDERGVDMEILRSLFEEDE
ncbi:hypothetical protein [Streptomyces sp. NPDC002132]|uniref:hypothetical protein n=1 Tax=unclassified Streptomyces TaxID=2593676 RepID=UPI00333083BB